MKTAKENAKIVNDMFLEKNAATCDAIEKAIDEAVNKQGNFHVDFDCKSFVLCCKFIWFLQRLGYNASWSSGSDTVINIRW